MSHARKTHAERREDRKRRDAAGEIRVTWRHVSHPYVGLSGYGPLGVEQLVYVREKEDDVPFNRSVEPLYEFGWYRSNILEAVGTRGNVTAAKQAAEALFQPVDRCDECGGPLAGWAGEKHSQQCSRATGELRTILVHVNVGLTDNRTAEQVEAAIRGALEVGSDNEAMSGLRVEVALAEEV